MEVSSFAHRKTALLLQASYCDYQIGAFENFHQPVEDVLIVLRPGPKIFFQNELSFANCLNGQLVIGHPFLPIKKWCLEETKNQTALGNIMSEKASPILDNAPLFLNYPINFYFRTWEILPSTP
jgi:hypothetical protein